MFNKANFALYCTNFTFHSRSHESGLSSHTFILHNTYSIEVMNFISVYVGSISDSAEKFTNRTEIS